MVQLRDDVVGLDSSVIMSPKVWEASGHLEVFTDPLVECLNCHQRFRADHLPGVHAPQSGHEEDETTVDMTAKPTCPNCGHTEFTDPRNFNLMFKTHMGPVEDESNAVYLRPETAQGILVDFPAVQQTSRKKVPFGIAQIGKSFRNEITPGNFIYRTREFEQMELEFFVKPGSDEEWHEYWIAERMRWYTDLGMNADHLRVREHDADELSHYSKRTVDVEYRFPFTDWGELEGIANRTDFDLKKHQEASGQDLTYFDAETEERYHPYVIEPAAGADRTVLAFLLDAYREEEAPTASGKARSAPCSGCIATWRRSRPPCSRCRATSGWCPGPGGLRRGEDQLDVRLRRRGVDRTAVPAAGRGGHAVLRHRGLRHAGRPAGDGARAGRYDAGPPPDRVVGGAPARSSVRTPSRDARLWLYVVAFLLMAAAGFTLAVAARGFLASTRLLWFSAGMSAAAIVAAVASVVWPAARPEP